MRALVEGRAQIRDNTLNKLHIVCSRIISISFECAQYSDKNAVNEKNIDKNQKLVRNPAQELHPEGVRIAREVTS